MASRTQIVCLHEGQQGHSIDPIFIRRLIKTLNPAWIRPWPGSNVIRLVPCEGRSSVIARMPEQLKACIAAGGHATLMVWADLDHDMGDGDELKRAFWVEAQAAGITKTQFDQVVFIFAKDRLENWIQYLNTGTTDESQEGPRVKHGRHAAEAAMALATRCTAGAKGPALPPSLEWSCRNWRTLVSRMR